MWAGTVNFAKTAENAAINLPHGCHLAWSPQASELHFPKVQSQFLHSSIRSDFRLNLGDVSRYHVGKYLPSVCDSQTVNSR